MTRLRFLFTALIGCACSLSVIVSIVHADTSAVIVIDQISPKEYGPWQMFSGDAILASTSNPNVSKKHYTFSSSHYGPATFSLTNPPGMSSTIQVYRGTDLVLTSDTPQVNISLVPNDTIRIIVQYARTSLGTMGVTTAPSNVHVMIKGPDGKERKALSPYTFTGLPAGRYTVSTPKPPEKCASAAPVTRAVESDKRLVVHLTLSCDQDDVSRRRERLRIRPTKRDIQNSVYLREAQRANRK